EEALRVIVQLAARSREAGLRSVADAVTLLAETEIEPKQIPTPAQMRGVQADNQTPFLNEFPRGLK
ncbi:MAG: hypothetical protein K2V38_20240, partial [Gemmataceae bacterium]|nr:hypothetical protein [Gemmataceae bacterium]